MAIGNYETDLSGYLPYCNVLVNPEKGTIISVKGRLLGTGSKYLMCSLIEEEKQKTKYVHRVIYECVFGKIPEDKDIDHIDGNTKNNKISNLQLLTHRENLLKAMKNRTHQVYHNKEMKPVEAFNPDTWEYITFPSECRASKYLNISAGMIHFCCEGKKYYEQLTSKNDGSKWKFTYAKKKNITLTTDEKRLLANIRVQARNKSTDEQQYMNNLMTKTNEIIKDKSTASKIQQYLSICKTRKFKTI